MTKRLATAVAVMSFALGCARKPTAPVRPASPESIDEQMAQALKQVDPIVLYEREPIPDEENAWPLWRKAIDELDRIADTKPEDVVDDALFEGLPAAESDAGKRLAEWLARCEPVVALVDEGIARGRCQLPETKGPQTDFSYLAPLREIARTRLLRARRFASVGEWDSAAREATGIVGLGDMIADGEGPVMHHLMGIGVQGMGFGSMRDLTGTDGVPEVVLAGLADGLRPPIVSGKGFARTLQVEFSRFFVQSVALLELEIAEKGLFEALLPCVDPFIIALGSEQEKEEARDKLRAGLPSDATLDVAETIHLGAQIHARLVRSAESPWREREAATDSGLPRSIEELKADPPAENAVGELLAGMLTQAMDAAMDRSFRARADRAATRTIVALRLYEMRRGRLPDSLGALVSEGIMDAVPVDPFSDEPLRYSKERCVVWSVGPDEKDDGGRDEPASWRGKDYVLSVPGGR